MLPTTNVVRNIFLVTYSHDFLITYSQIRNKFPLIICCRPPTSFVTSFLLLILMIFSLLIRKIRNKFPLIICCQPPTSFVTSFLLLILMIRYTLCSNEWIIIIPSNSNKNTKSDYCKIIKSV